MLIRIKNPSVASESEVTPHALYLRRREFLRLGAGVALAAGTNMAWPEAALAATMPLPNVTKSTYRVSDAINSLKDITHYNNFYEFTTEKEDVAKVAANFVSRPWTVEISGEIDQPQRIDIDALIKRYPLEERVYRLRCVEAWSMVIPWVGFPLAKLIKDAAPRSNAKYVEFTTLLDPERMPNQKRKVLPWPYVEGLRMDEAMHPLTLMAVGLYGETLPPPNGAPLRLVVPWKYGFKSIKSIVRIRFVEQAPLSTWQQSGPREYGFYANVNPEVDHPRWSQARERRIGEFLKRPTLPFNGYADEVASLYAGMDLRKHY